MAPLTACSACSIACLGMPRPPATDCSSSVIERFGDAEAIAVLDETGIPKKGPHSAGVHKQYCGALGKIENCQVATLVTYATAREHVFLDRRLFLPEEWCLDRARRGRAKVPAEVSFQTKPEQARAMLEHAWQAGVPMRSRDGRFGLWGRAPPAGAHSSAGLLVCAGHHLEGRAVGRTRPRWSCLRNRPEDVLDVPCGWLRTLPGPAPWVR